MWYVKKRFPKPLLNLARDVKHIYNTIKFLRGVHKRTCAVCGFEGYFRAAGTPIRPDARCPKCSSLERHRLLALAHATNGIFDGNQYVLHFAPEPCVQNFLEPKVRQCVTADLFDPDADIQENIEKLTLPDEEFDLIVCSHVLEHVDDRKAISELFRVLKRDGVLIAMVPIVEGWEKTYENSEVISPDQRTLHFGQKDHVRYYGADFRQRLGNSGFIVQDYTANGADSIKFGLMRGEKVFICRKHN